METVVARVWMESARGVVLDRLWQSLVRTLRRRVPRADAAADVASEVVHRAIRRSFFDLFFESGGLGRVVGVEPAGRGEPHRRRSAPQATGAT